MAGRSPGSGDAREAFLEGLVDYAGLFPPARLPMDEAVASYTESRGGPYGWVLGRFICPASGLPQLAEHLPETSSGQPWAISVVINGAGESWEDGTDCDLEASRKFAEQCSSRARIELLEVRLPDMLVGQCDPAALAGEVQGFAEKVESSGLGWPVAPFFEIPLGAEWRRAVPATLEGLAEVRRVLPLEKGICLAPGAKIRCGGATAEAHPSPEQVAAFVAACDRFGVPFKATAGLHHPFRHADNAETGFVQHGFINLGGAAVLHSAHGLSEAELTDLVSDELSSNFSLTSREFRWRGYGATAREISRIRAGLFTAYGSCSFVEPVEDLVELGVLPVAV